MQNKNRDHLTCSIVLFWRWDNSSSISEMFPNESSERTRFWEIKSTSDDNNGRENQTKSAVNRRPLSSPSDNWFVADCDCPTSSCSLSSRCPARFTQVSIMIHNTNSTQNSPSWSADKAVGRTNGSYSLQISVQINILSISCARRVLATVNRFGPFARWASSRACLCWWRDSTPWTRARPQTASQRRDMREYFQRHDPGPSRAAELWSRAVALAWERRWCDRADSGTS